MIMINKPNSIVEHQALDMQAYNILAMLQYINLINFTTYVEIKDSVI